MDSYIKYVTEYVAETKLYKCLTDIRIIMPIIIFIAIWSYIGLCFYRFTNPYNITYI